MSIISLVIGDWSSDGHGRTETVSIDTNLTTAAIQKAYKAGVKSVGVNVVEKICADYEDSQIPFEDWKKLNRAGLTLADLELTGYDLEQAKKSLDNDSGIGINYEHFVNLYCFIVKQGNPEFTFKIVENPHLNIGGYGLFYS